MMMVIITIHHNDDHDDDGDDDDDNDDDVDLNHDDDDGQIYNCRCDSFTRRCVENSPWILSHQTGYPFIQWWRWWWWWWWRWWWIEIIELFSLVKTTCRAPSASISRGMLNKVLHFAETLNWEGCTIVNWLIMSAKMTKLMHTEHCFFCFEQNSWDFE